MSNAFDTHLTNLLKVAIKISGSVSGFGTSPVWVSWVSKFLQAYNSAKNPPAFHDMFMMYFHTNASDIASPIMAAGGRIQDAWLRDCKTSKSHEGTWSMSGIQPRGQIIYYSVDPKLKSVSIPLTEIYLASIKLYRDGKDKDTFAATAPSNVLYNFYSIYAALLPTSAPERASIVENQESMKQALELSGVSDVNATTTQTGGGALKDVGTLVRTLIERSGYEIPQEDADKMEKTMGNIMESDVLSHITKAVGSATISGEGIDKAGNPDIGAILANVGHALQNPQVKEAIATVSEKTQKQTETLLDSIPSGQGKV